MHLKNHWLQSKYKEMRSIHNEHDDQVYKDSVFTNSKPIQYGRNPSRQNHVSSDVN